MTDQIDVDEERIKAIDDEVEDIEQEIMLLESRRAALLDEKECILDKIIEPEQLADHDIDRSYEWSSQLKQLAKRHWNIDSFRPLQEPILNAALEQKRDIFVVLPTGGGKSLCYQLPALIQKGFALVVSPLVSLIQDQVFDLQKANVPAAMLTGASSKSYITEVQDAMTTGRKQEDMFKLLYVTPEKIAKSKAFTKALGAAYDAGRLSRIIIDEAHCCSQQGHDFRPDYGQLGMLRKMCDKTRIMALTATCPWKVMQDVLAILDMEQPRKAEGTLVYSAPLYRPNLKYQVVPKPKAEKEIITHMTEWILANHKNETGIIYCLTKSDTEKVSEAIMTESGGKIKCAVYNADVESDERELIHSYWRKKVIHVVVATIAFGMGINHLETRFIIHHSMSKSLENYYQESGRAGRDGKPADCIMYYRGQDAPRLSKILYNEVYGGASLYTMIRYAQEYKTCRKIEFEKYLTVDPTLSGASSRLVNPISPDKPCGICDNCTRNPDDVVVEDITKLAVSLVRMCSLLNNKGEKVPMGKLIQHVQGQKLNTVNLEYLLRDHSKVDIPLAKRYTANFLERVINQLLIERFLKETFTSSPFNSYSYLIEGPKARELLDQNERDDGRRKVTIEIAVLQGDRKGNARSGAKRRRKASPEVITIDDD